MTKRFPRTTRGFNPFGDLIGLSFLRASKGTSRCRLEVGKKLLNPHHVLHGGVLFSMADTGMGAALYTLLGKSEACATKWVKIRYLKPVRAGTLYCRTRVLRKNSRQASLTSEITAGKKLVATARGTFAIGRNPRPAR